MGDGLLMLSWKNHSSTFSHLISSLREKDHYTDVTLACNGKFYPAHKIVLSACSQYFEEMLQNTPCKHPIIVLKDISANELDALLNYMYVGEVSVSQNNLTALIKAAESLHIKGLAVPDESPSNLAKENRGRPVSNPLTDERFSPPAKRLRQEKQISPPRESPVASPPQGRERSLSLEDDPRTYPERESRVPPLLESEKSHFESTSHHVKTETLSVPSSPVLSDDKAEEPLSNQSIIQDSHISPGGNEARSHSNQSYHSQEGFEQVFDVKEEYIENDTDRSTPDVSFTPPTASVAATSPSLTSVPLASTASGMTALSPTSLTTNQRPPADNSSFEDHIRTLLYNPQERREASHTEASFHGPGPSGLLGNLGLNIREGFRTGGESFNAKRSDIYPVQVGGSRAHPSCEACSTKKVHLCSSCYYSTPWHSVFVRHIRKHTGEKPFFCPFCPFRSGWKSHLASHIKKNHALQ